MAFLGGISYNPAAAVTFATTAAAPLAAIDTTNARVTFNAPSSGVVWAIMEGTIHGAATFPQILFGILSGSTVMAVKAPIGGIKGTNLATTYLTMRARMLIKNLTAGQSYNFDAALAVELGVASTGLKYGGLNDSTASNAYGALSLEIFG